VLAVLAASVAGSAPALAAALPTIRVAAAPAPTTSSFSPSSGPVGSWVNVSGTGLLVATNVQIGGKDAQFWPQPDGSVTVLVPAGAMTGRIRIVTPTGAVQTSSPFTVTKTVPPTIASFAPSSGVPSMQLTITGAGFTNATSVEFGGKEAAFYTNGDSMIVVTVPAGATTGKIRVATPAGAVQSSSMFTVIKPSVPKVTSFAPMSGAVGSTIVITGSGFIPGWVRDGSESVSINGQPAIYSVDSPTQITATVPAGTPVGRIRVMTSGGAGQSSATFSLVPVGAPTITSVTESGQGSYIIRGTNLQNATGINVAGRWPQMTAQYSDTQLGVVAARGTAFGKIVVSTPLGQVTSADTVQLQWYQNTSATSGAVGDAKVFTGQFAGVTAVTINGVPAPITSTTPAVGGDIQVQVTVPAGATSGPVEVTCSAGTFTLPGGFTVL
jgi:uncharacterized protein (TIGR03437 family)